MEKLLSQVDTSDRKKVAKVQRVHFFHRYTCIYIFFFIFFCFPSSRFEFSDSLFLTLVSITVLTVYAKK